MTTATHQYNHLPPGHPDNPKAWAICGSRTRQEMSNDVCTQAAGWGTSHPGVGRCKLHGGANLSGPDSPKWKHGRYAHAFNGELARHWQAIRTSDDDPLDLLPELEMLQAVLAWHVEHVSDDMSAGDMVHLTTVIAPAAGDSPAQADTDSDALIVDGNENETSIAIGVGSSGGSKSKHNRKSSSSKPRAQLATLDEKLALIKDLTDSIVNLVSRVIAARNQTALTKAELVWLQTGMVGLINEFIPDTERRRAFVARLAELLPTGVSDASAARDDQPAKRNRLPAPTQASEAD